MDGIEKSKKLANKLKTPKNKRKTGTPRNGIRKSRASILEETHPSLLPRRNNVVTNQTKFCSNNKPMPSLAELERMYDGSDDELPSLTTTKPLNSVPQKPESPEKCKTPEPAEVIDLDKLQSPTKIKELSNKLFDYLTSLPDIMNVDNDQPSPVIPPKKRKKPEVPYIVGCKDREQLSDWVSSAVIGAGDTKYGIDPKDVGDDDDDTCAKRQKKSNIPTPQHSQFNAQSEEIAARLKQNDSLSDCSNDSNKTVSYEYMSSHPRSFSPLPSTSRDNDVFLKNDMRFNESLMVENANDSQQSDVQLIEEPRETITIEDEPSIKESSALHWTEDEVEIVDKTPVKKIFDDDNAADPYSSIITIDEDNSYVSEVIDLDEIIAAQQSVFKKYRKQKPKQEVINVEPSAVILLDTPDNKKTKTDKRSLETPECTIVTDDTTQNTNKDKNTRDDDPKDQNSVKFMGIVNNFFRNITNTRPIELVDLCDSGTSYSDVENIKELSKSIASSFKSNSLVTSKAITISDKQSPNSHNTQSPVLNSIAPHRNRRDTALSRESEKIEIVSDYLVRGPSSFNSNISQVQQNYRPKVNSRGNKRKATNPRAPAITELTSPQCAAVAPSPILPSPQSKHPVRSIGECPICMENLSNKSIASTVCGHLFCTECIQAAVKNSGKKCPTCRKKLTGVGFHKIFL